MKQQMNFGALPIDWLIKCVEKAEMKKSTDKPLTKVFHGRLLSIVPKKKLGIKIKDDEGEPLNVHKVMSPQLFVN